MSLILSFGPCACRCGSGPTWDGIPDSETDPAWGPPVPRHVFFWAGWHGRTDVSGNWIEPAAVVRCAHETAPFPPYTDPLGLAMRTRNVNAWTDTDGVRHEAIYVMAESRPTNVPAACAVDLGFLGGVPVPGAPAGSTPGYVYGTGVALGPGFSYEGSLRPLLPSDTVFPIPRTSAAPSFLEPSIQIRINPRGVGWGPVGVPNFHWRIRFLFYY